MEIILKQDVERLGKTGAVIKVKDGFALNFLIPRGLAIPMTETNLKKLQEEKRKKTLLLEKAKEEALALMDKLSALSLTMPVLAHEDDKLYGSITAQDISAALKEEGFNIDKSLISLQEPIKSLGIYEVPVNLHPEVSTQIKIWVVKK